MILDIFTHLELEDSKPRASGDDPGLKRRINLNLV